MNHGEDFISPLQVLNFTRIQNPNKKQNIFTWYNLFLTTRSGKGHQNPGSRNVPKITWAIDGPLGSESLQSHIARCYVPCSGLFTGSLHVASIPRHLRRFFLNFFLTRTYTAHPCPNTCLSTRRPRYSVPKVNPQLSSFAWLHCYPFQTSVHVFSMGIFETPNSKNRFLCRQCKTFNDLFNTESCRTRRQKSVLREGCVHVYAVRKSSPGKGFGCLY